MEGANAYETCLDCPPGTWTEPGASACTPCGQGTSTNGLSRAPKCDACVRGSFAAGTGNAECTQCPLGTFATEERATSCNDCQPGRYAADLGSTACSLCPPGSFTPDTKQAECICCPEGEFIYESFLGATSNLCQEVVINSTLADIDPFSQTDECLAQEEELGNGICSPYANTLACGWDQGDCCFETCAFNKNLTDSSCLFQTLQCLDPDPGSHAIEPSLRRPSDFDRKVTDVILKKADCANDPRVGDGLCNDELNFAECGDFDGGDCCPSTCRTKGCKFGQCKRFDCKSPDLVAGDLPTAPILTPLPQRALSYQCSEQLVGEVAVAAIAPPSLINGNSIIFDPAVNVDDSITPGKCSNDFVITRTISSTEDTVGQKAIFKQTITVIDNTKPSLNVILSGLTEPIESKDVAKYTPDVGSTTDNCEGGATVFFTETRDVGECSNKYVLSRKWVATDACGNDSEVITESISVIDTIAPSYTSREIMAIWPPNSNILEFSLLDDFGFGEVTDDCGTSPQKYCDDSVTVQFISCLDSEAALAADCTYDGNTGVLSIKADLDGQNSSPRDYTITVRVLDACENFVDTINVVRVMEPDALTDDTSCLYTKDTFNTILVPNESRYGPDYKLGSTTPGKFVYHVFQLGEPGELATISVQIPYPFVTQGTSSIFAYDQLEIEPGPENEPCFLPRGQKFFESDIQVTLDDYAGVQCGDSKKVLIQVITPSTGFIHLLVNLDFGLKGRKRLSKSSKDVDNDFLPFNGIERSSKSSKEEEFEGCSFNFSTNLGSRMVANTNVFKENKGVSGFVIDAFHNPLSGITVSLFLQGKEDRGELSSIETDEDGYYDITLKPKSRKANDGRFVVKTSGQAKSITFNRGKDVKYINFLVGKLVEDEPL